MNESDKETVDVAASERKRVVSFDVTAENYDDDDDLDIDVKSSTDSDNILDETDGIESVSKQSVKIVRKKTPMVDLLASRTDQQAPKDASKALYDYATVVHQKSDEPHQSRLNEDVTAVHGSSDPPPGFGVLHPPVRYLKQNRPIPLEPLPVWRGYNGNIYFSPIQVQRLESDRLISYTKSPPSASTNSIQSRRKTETDQSDAVSSTCTNRDSTKQRNQTHRRTQKPTMTQSKIPTINSGLKKHRLIDPTNELDEDHEPIKPWHSFFTNSRTRLKPIRKSERPAAEDASSEKSLQNTTRQKRQVLPNIRLVPKPKLIHKGLAYKESQRYPSFTSENSNDALKETTTLFEMHTQQGTYTMRANTKYQQLPPISTTAMITREHAILDLREIRKRIIKGSTTLSRTPVQSMAWSPRSIDRTRTSTIELLVPTSTIDSSNRSSEPSVSPRNPHKHHTAYTTPNHSEYFEVFATDTNVNVS